ncbi:hypothetical protein [Vibrio sp. YIC-376]|uniref:hypothetical protein n=1 Tax=Vibrio sp. YIC-376 TaxID=3136162 RepID=UPI00402AD989
MQESPTDKVVLTHFRIDESSQKPKIGVSATTLGVRIQGFNVEPKGASDISCDNKGMVHAENKGMSVERPPAKDMPPFLQDLPRFSCQIELIEESGKLKVVNKYPDDPSKDDKLVIAPAYSMHASEYYDEVVATQHLWLIGEKGEDYDE